MIEHDTVLSTGYIRLKKAIYGDESSHHRYWDYVERVGHQHNLADAVSVLAFYKNGIVITKEFRPAINDYEWSLPSGLRDYAECSTKTAERELKEETGLNLTETLAISPLHYSSAGLTNESNILVIGRATGEINPEKGIEVKVIKPDDVYSLAPISSKLYLILYMMCHANNLSRFFSNS